MFPKQSQKSKSILSDGFRYLRLFWAGNKAGTLSDFSDTLYIFSETAKFYKALAMVGIDFFLIQKMLPNRKRFEIKVGLSSFIDDVIFK